MRRVSADWLMAILSAAWRMPPSAATIKKSPSKWERRIRRVGSKGGKCACAGGFIKNSLNNTMMHSLHQAFINRHFQAYRLLAKFSQSIFNPADQTDKPVANHHQQAP
jgi:hypothetical protein